MSYLIWAMAWKIFILVEESDSTFGRGLRVVVCHEPPSHPALFGSHQKGVFDVHADEQLSMFTCIGIGSMPFSCQRLLTVS